jgi:hypothetical protein
VRLSAHELENQVTEVVRRFLADKGEVLEKVRPVLRTPTAIAEILKKASELDQTSMMEAQSGRHQILRDLITRVQINTNDIQISLNRDKLNAALSIVHSERDLVARAAAEPIVLTVPTELQQQGQERHLIIATDKPVANRDPVLIKALTRAYQWFELLKEGQVESIAEIARQEKLTRSYISTLLPLAFLAPDITEAIFAGSQPVGLNLDRLLRLRSLPSEWTAQRVVLGFKR